MVEEVGSKVKKLKRIRIESIVLDGLQDGQIKHLSAGEKNQLFEIIGLEN
jgi:16S rRNA U516 pseudouridylate synthase RsuA-like enzyme